MSHSVAKETSYINNALINVYDPLRIEDTLMSMYEDYKDAYVQRPERSRSMHQYAGALYSGAGYTDNGTQADLSSQSLGKGAATVGHSTIGGESTFSNE